MLHDKLRHQFPKQEAHRLTRALQQEGVPYPDGFIDKLIFLGARSTGAHYLVWSWLVEIINDWHLVRVNGPDDGLRKRAPYTVITDVYLTVWDPVGRHGQPELTETLAEQVATLTAQLWDPDGKPADAIDEVAAALDVDTDSVTWLRPYSDDGGWWAVTWSKTRPYAARVELPEDDEPF